PHRGAPAPLSPAPPDPRRGSRRGCRPRRAQQASLRALRDAAAPWRCNRDRRAYVYSLSGFARQLADFPCGRGSGAARRPDPNSWSLSGSRPRRKRLMRRRTLIDAKTGAAMPEVFFNGPAGRLEGRFHPAKQRGAPIAVVLHPHPQFGGTMNNQIVYNTYYNFAERGFSVLRFNFRGVGRSQGAFDHGQGELSDAASALDWAQTISPEARACWIA